MIFNWQAKAKRPFSFPTTWQQLPLGEAYSNALQRAFAPWLPKILGYQVLKLGALSAEVPIALPMRHQMLVSEKISPNLTALLTPSDTLIQAKLTALPFVQKEINAAFLANTLNFAQDPHQILRETHRVLTDDGWLFLSLFNPLSPLIFKTKLGEFPFRQYPTWRIIDWLELLHFDIVACQNLAIKAQQATPFSPLTLIVAQKRCYPLTLNTEKVRSKTPVFLQPAEAFQEEISHSSLSSCTKSPQR
ncbi:class I SAM-dependent methyltransferase [Rodentibacter trehalosifermentans]|uniref:SAM-dependent methyltransferase n=1 Tax=Rodentibacter trehalosifermentans TaxID=1908263 RepID=A0A1V3IQL5_9PAST|nr:methyltransferase domain-containing protein [Rodentibacter trehalosifermentans]OOF44340.1 SAM-dependent methyltransferase [Rodentibacter trehalosifermentans]OOF47714.1 SAM-dependent methyltransferase [Rodentibacter trehalosifermentans]OOF49247.1 SAM-dependent methyltransferase [Rodentibacter trehalosifermentans]